MSASQPAPNGGCRVDRALILASALPLTQSAFTDREFPQCGSRISLFCNHRTLVFHFAPENSTRLDKTQSACMRCSAIPARGEHAL